MIISTFKSERDNAPASVSVTWEELVAMLTTHERRRDKSGPAWSPAEFAGRRAVANVLGVSCLVFDLDHLSLADLEGVAKRIEASGLASILHSTHSHTHANVSVRLVLDTNRIVLASEFARVRAEVARRYEIPADEKAKDAARLYYLPSAPEGVPVIAGSTEGAQLNVDELLAASMPAPANTVAPAQVTNTAPTVADGAAPANVADVRRRLRSLGNPLVNRLLDGLPLAEEGGRDDALQKAMGACAFKLGDSVPVDLVLEIARDSVRAMPGALPDSGDWLVDARMKYERGLERRRESDKRKREFEDAMRAEFASEAAQESGVTLGPGAKYSEEQLRGWVQESGMTPAEFENKWIIQKGSTFYVFSGGRYLRPIVDKELRVSVLRDLAAAPFDLFETNKDGKSTFNVQALLDRRSSVARDIVARLDIQKSFYDPKTQAFHEAVCPLRVVEPVYDPQVDEWLGLVGGDLLRQWVAAATRLDRQCAALYLDGAPGIGKSLLVSGLARLWTVGTPSEIGSVLDGFNESLCRCPLVVADETLPNDPDITAKLRRMVGSTRRVLNRKFMPTASLEGSIRLAILGNNDRLLDSMKEMSIEDQKAVAGRFLYIKAGEAAAEFLKRVGGPPVVDAWIKNDTIAKHALYLRDTVELAESERFLVQGAEQEFHDHLAVTTRYGGVVCEWLMKYLADPRTLTPRSDSMPMVIVGSGELFVNPAAMTGATWDQYVPSDKIPSATKLSNAIRNMSTEQTFFSTNGKRLGYYRLKTSILIAQTNRTLLGDIDAITARISRPNPVVDSVLTDVTRTSKSVSA